jgi:hypothetical protein
MCNTSLPFQAAQVPSQNLYCGISSATKQGLACPGACLPIEERILILNLGTLTGGQTCVFLQEQRNCGASPLLPQMHPQCQRPGFPSGETGKNDAQIMHPSVAWTYDQDLLVHSRSDSEDCH